MLEKLVSEPVLHASAHLGYFSGLALLLPILSSAWEKSVKPWLLAPYGFLIAAALIIVGIVLLAFVAGSISKLVKSLGWMMFIPGVLALVFASFGQTNVYAWAGSHITGFAAAQPVVNLVVEHAVPKVAYLGGMYILLGVCLVWLGRRIGAIGQFV